MKILRLELRAFGPFTNMSLDFSGEGLHIVYGPNEAGKSSTLRALRALLYGIPERTQDNFLHDNTRLRIGGLLRHSDGSELFCLRRKGRLKTLLDNDEKEMDEAVLRRYLGNVTAELFDRMFGLTHTDLVRGGKDIIAGGGDLGESLFSAGLGGSGFRELLHALEAEAEELFAPRGTRKVINSALNEIAEAKNAVRNLALQGRDWETHQEALAGASRKKQGFDKELRSLRGERERLDRLLRALPLISAYKEAVAKRQEMGEVLILPTDFAADRRRLTESLSQGRSVLEKTQRQMAETKEELEAISVPEELLKHGETISRLYKRLGSHEKAMSDLPGLKGQRAQIEAAVVAILKELAPALPFEEAERLRLTEAERQRIGEMGGRLQGLEEELRAVRKSAGVVKRRLETDRGDEAPTKELRDPKELRDLLRSISREGDLEAQLRKAASELLAEEDQARVDLQRLGLWTGSLEEIESLAAPSPETMERFIQGFSRNGAAMERNRTGTEEVIQEIARTEAQLESLRLEGNVPTEADLDAARRRRERGWQLVRRAWLEGGVTELEVNAYAAGEPIDRSYAQSVVSADEIADRLRREAQRVARKAACLAGRKGLEGDLKRLEEERQSLKEGQQALSEDWSRLWEGTGISPLPPEEMKGWVSRQETLALKVRKIRAARRETEVLKETILKHRTTLLTAFSGLGESFSGGQESLGFLLEKAEEIAERIEGERNRAELLRKNISELEKELARQQEEEAHLSADLAGLRYEWGEAVRPLDLDESASQSVAAAVLRRNQEFFVRFDQINGLSQRIEAMVKERDLFAGEVKDFCFIVAPDMEAMPVEIAVAELHERLAMAQKDSARRTVLTEKYNAAVKEFQEAQEGVAEMEGRLAEIFRRAACSTEEEIREREAQSADALGLEAKISDLHGQLLNYTKSGGTVDDLIGEAEGVDRDSLPGEISWTDQRIAGMEAEISALDQTIGSERKEIERMDGSSLAAEAAEKNQELLSRLRDLAEHYLRLRMASSLLHSEIERYRTANQGPILTRASGLFSMLTMNSFSALKTEYTSDDRPVLAGLRSNGEVVHSTGMSEGTCDQLYLALRLASLEKHLAESEPLPFILDDILIHFDDARSKAVLKVLSELSGRMQVILFTHHSHIVDLAESVVSPGMLQISRLPLA